jgi:hypothetical protein
MAQLAGLAKPSSLTVMHVCSIDHVARMLGEAPRLLEAIIYNDNNLSERRKADENLGRATHCRSKKCAKLSHDAPAAEMTFLSG